MGIVKTSTVGPNEGVNLNLTSGPGGFVYVNGQIITGSGSVIIGPQGDVGATGSIGTTGATGATGSKGDKGDQGLTGLDGITSPAGLTWRGTWSGTQSYATNSVVGYASASWWSKVNIAGIVGPVTPNSTPNLDTTRWAFLSSQGPVGPQGVKGATGPQGPTGIGLQGIQGPQGPTGAAGPVGSGLQGIQGPQGPTGAAGPGIASQVTFIPQGLSVTGSNVQLALTQLETLVISQINSGEVISTSVNATASIVVYDYSLSNLWYHGTASSNFTANFINLPTTNNRVLSASIIISQGLNAYIPNKVQIAGITQSVKWPGGTQSGTSYNLDIITFNFIRTGATWSGIIGQVASFT